MDVKLKANFASVGFPDSVIQVTKGFRGFPATA